MEYYFNSLLGREVAYHTNSVNEALRVACRSGHLEIVRLMMAHGTIDFGTGLHAACNDEHLRVGFVRQPIIIKEFKLRKRNSQARIYGGKYRVRDVRRGCEIKLI